MCKALLPDLRQVRWFRSARPGAGWVGSITGGLTDEIVTKTNHKLSPQTILHPS